MRRILGGLALLVGLASACDARAQTFSIERRLGVAPGVGEPILIKDARVAFDGASYVVVWSDEAPDRVDPTPGRGATVSRFSAAGELVASSRIRLDGVRALATDAAFRKAPWGSVLYGSRGVELRLDREGGRLSDVPDMLADSTPIGGKDRFILSCSESDCLATWVERPVGAATEGSAPATVGIAVDACGEPVPGTELELPLGRFVSEYGGEVHLLFGLDQKELAAGRPVAPRAAAIARDGRVLWGPHPVGQVALTATNDSLLALGFGAGAFLGAWVSTEGGSSKLWVTSLSPAGESGRAHLLRETTEPVSSLSLAWEGSDFRLVFGVESALYSLRLDPNGESIDAEPTVLVRGDCLPTRPGVASDGESSLVVWSWDDGCVGAPPSALRMPGNGAASESLSLTTSGVPIDRASFASNGTGYLAAWVENKTEGSGVYVQHLDEDGGALGPETLAIPGRIDVTSGFGAFVVDGHYFVSQGSQTFNLDTETPEPAPAGTCAITPGTYLVPQVVEYPSRGEDDTLRKNGLTAELVRVDSCGSTLESAQTWSTGSDGAIVSRPLVAFDGEHFAFVWHESDTLGGEAVRFVSFDGAGQPLSAIGVLGGSSGYPVALAWVGQAFLLVLDSGQMWRLEGAAGALSGQSAGFAGSAISTAIIAKDGDTSLVGFSSDDVSVARVAPDATVSSPVVVANDSEPEGLIALVPGGDGRTLVAYVRFDDEPSYGVDRTFYRVLGTGACTSLDRCTGADCDECCAGGCAQATPVPECNAPACSVTCPPGTHCAAGLGCLPEAPKPRLASIPARHSGCGISPEASSNSLAMVLATLLGAVVRGRRKRKPPTAHESASDGR